MPADCRPEQARAHAVRRLAAFLAAEPAIYRAVAPGAREDTVIELDAPGITLSCAQTPPGTHRFIPPTDWNGEPLTPMDGLRPLARVVLRVDSTGTADVWMRINHVAADGVPMQEVLSRLELAWGGADAVRFPTHDEFASVFEPSDLADRPGFAEGQCFMNFAPLLKWKAAVARRLDVPFTLSAAIQWHLGRHPRFGAHAIGSTVETTADQTIDRGVGVVVVCPRHFSGDDAGLASFISEYNRAVEKTRRRASAAIITLDAAAHLPPLIARHLLTRALQRDPKAFGDAALTVLRHARVFGVPIGSVGHVHGFLAVGDVTLPATDGTRVGCVTFKGPRPVVERLPLVLREAVDHAARASG